MLKIRIMGTKNDIVWFERALSRIPRTEIQSSSGIFPNKGTEKYHRKYVEIARKNTK